MVLWQDLYKGTWGGAVAPDLISWARHVKVGHLFAVAAILLLALSPPFHRSIAEFNLNFVPDDGTYSSNDAYVSCNMSYIASANCNGFNNDFSFQGSHIDGTSFYQRMFDDGSGNRYFQVIVGDYTTDSFALEYIIKADASADGVWYSGGWGDTDIARSASAGDPNDRLYNMTKPYDTADTQSTSSGTGTGNPTRVIMKQILTDVGTSMDFTKDTFAGKPFMSQTTSSGSDMSSYIEFDLRGKDHTDITPVTDITHTLTLTGADKPTEQSGDFDYNAIKHDSVITAGGYTYTDGSGANDFGGSNGTYNYWNAAEGDEFQPVNIDYAGFCDATQNPDWSGNGACKNDDGTGGGGGWNGGSGRGGWGW